MKKTSEKPVRRATPDLVPDRGGRNDSAVAVEGPAPGATTTPYRVVWRCSFGPREAAAADAESSPPNDETR